MDAMTELALATIAFVGGHFLLSSAPLRRPLVGLMGERPFVIFYSGVAFVAFAWLLRSYSQAPHVELWPSLEGLRFIPMLVMPLAVLLVVGGYTQHNPTAVMQSMPDRGSMAPGVLAITRHPVMWGIALWALSHIPSRGNLASLLLFGGMAILALGGTVAIDAKKRRQDPAGFARLEAATSNLPFLAIREGRAQMAGLEQWRLLLAAAVYFGLMIAHPWLFGVSAM